MTKSLKGTDMKLMSATLQAMVRKKLREAFTAYFVTMTTSTDGWPEISDQEFVEAIADSLIAMGDKRKLGKALLQTMIYELQDRANLP